MPGFGSRFGGRRRSADVALFARVAATGDVDTSSAPAPSAAVWDGATLAVGDPVFLGRQDAATSTGLYTYRGEGAALRRHSRMRDGGALYDGLEVSIGQGADGKNARWRLTTDLPAGGFVIGSTALSWTEIRAASANAGTEQIFGCPGAASVGAPVYVDGAGSVALARADDTDKGCALVVTEKINPTRCRATTAGRVSGLSALVAGTVYWLGEAGGLVATAPAAGSGLLAQRVGVAVSSTEIDLIIDRALVVA